MLTSQMIELLQCPTCQAGELSPNSQGRSGDALHNGQLMCTVCDSSYPVLSGVPALFPHGELGSDAWRVWQEHLEKFRARREYRIRNPDRPVTQWGHKSKPQHSFAQFTQITEGRILDLGCGPGKFRFKFDETRVSYYGLDPIPLAEAAAFPFAQGVAEYIPFKSGTFSDVCVLAAMDHFKDLDRAFTEVARVLVDGGRFHILQSVHEVRGPVSLVKMVGHRIKDALEERVKDSVVPKHLAEFSTSSLYECLSDRFEIVATDEYSGRWYAPTRNFLSVKSKRRSDMRGTGGVT